MMSTRRSLFRAGVLVVALIALGATSAWAQPASTYNNFAFEIGSDSIVVTLDTIDADTGTTTDNPTEYHLAFVEQTTATTTARIRTATEPTKTWSHTAFGRQVVSVTGLKPDTLYLIGIRGKNADGNQAWVYPNSTTVASANTVDINNSYVETKGATAADVIEPVKVSLSPVGRDSIKIAWVPRHDHGRQGRRDADQVRGRVDGRWTDDRQVLYLAVPAGGLDSRWRA